MSDTYTIDAGRLRFAVENTPRVKHAATRGEPHDMSVLEDIRFNVPSSTLVVEVGAGIGVRTLWLAADGNNVIAFEPVHTFELDRNVRRNWAFDIVRVEPVALGADVGWARKLENGHVEQVVLASQNVPPGVDVPVHKLDDYDIRPGVLLIDDVSRELDILRGAERTLHRSSPRIYVKLSRHENEVSRVIGPWGYTFQATYFGRTSTFGVWSAE